MAVVPKPGPRNPWTGPQGHYKGSCIHLSIKNGLQTQISEVQLLLHEGIHWTVWCQKRDPPVLKNWKPGLALLINSPPSSNLSYEQEKNIPWYLLLNYRLNDKKYLVLFLGYNLFKTWQNLKLLKLINSNITQLSSLQCYVILLFGKEQISRLCIIYSDTKWRL